MDDIQTKAVRATAEAAYMELLFGPVPVTTTDYRRAVMLAVLIGQVMATAEENTVDLAAPDVPQSVLPLTHP